MKPYKKIKCCRICKSKKIVKVIDLKSQYIQGSFIKRLSKSLHKNSITISTCRDCFLIQTICTVNKILYKNYWYSSG